MANTNFLQWKIRGLQANREEFTDFQFWSCSYLSSRNISESS